MAENKKKYIIGVDTGGTFTDVVVIDIETGESINAKSPTTPHDFSIGVINAIGEASQLKNTLRRDLLKQTLMLKHGTTVGTNSVVTRRGAKVGFITTKGFEDTTLIGRVIQRVDGLSDEEVGRLTVATKPEPLVPRFRVRGVYERIDAEGNIVVPLNTENAREQIRSLVEVEKVEAIGVSLLFSFVNPIHEQKIKELINQMYPDHDLYLAFSHEIVPLLKEYGRANTVILDCFIGKVMREYFSKLDMRLRDEGFGGKFLVMQCSGGTVGWERVAAVRTLSSGPAGGVIGSHYLAGQLGHENVISTDMGGTSFDVSLIRDGRFRYEREPIISRWRVMLPMIKCDSIGAGGGTIARVEPRLNRLLVGPDSAGAVPGPVCYGTGGTEPTVCDADLILGFLNPDYFMGGKIKLNKAKAEQAIREKIAIPLKMDLVEAAAGIVTIINSQMADLIRVIAMGVGLPPEQFVLYAFGGTGPMHATYYAGQLGIKQAYISRHSAVFSAHGIAGADIIQTASFSLGYPMPMNPDVLNNRIAEAQEFLAQEMEKEGFPRYSLNFIHRFNMRFRRQVNYHTISFPAKEYKTKGDVEALAEAWIEDFSKVYGKGVVFTKAGVELVSMDIDSIGHAVKPTIKRYPEGSKDPSAALKGHRDVFYPEISKGFVKTAIFEYDMLQPGNVIEGPAIVESPTSTIVILPEKLAKIDTSLNVVLEL